MYALEKKKKLNIFISKFKNKNTKINNNYTIKKKITKCEKKSAYISYSDEIELEMYFLGRNYADKNFYTGQDLIKKQSEGLLFYNALNTKIVSYYRWLVDSGIYERLEEEKLARRIKLRKNIRQNMQERKPKGVSSLEGGLVTLFILCGALISLVVTVFTVECHTKSGRIFAKCIIHMSAILKYCRRKRQRERNAAFLKHTRLAKTIFATMARSWRNQLAECQVWPIVRINSDGFELDAGGSMQRADGFDAAKRRRDAWKRRF